MKYWYKEGVFKNYRGQDQAYCIAAVVDHRDKYPLSIDELAQVVNNKECPICALQNTKMDALPTHVSIMFGVSFCNPKDEKVYDVYLGRKIAAGKALCDRSRIEEIQLTSGMLTNKDYINFCLTKLAIMVEAHPEKFSKSYEKAADSYRKHIAYLDNLPKACTNLETISKPEATETGVR